MQTALEPYKRWTVEGEGEQRASARVACGHRLPGSEAHGK